jgi:prolipoprotein diacylglyceryltransferase
MNAIIHTEHGEWVYPVMYLLAFMISSAYLLFETRKNRWPADSVVLMLGLTILSAVIGSKIVFLSATDYLSLFSHGSLPETYEKSFLGGLAGGLAGMLISLRLLKLPLEIGDKVALILPLSMAAGRTGCLFAGCCFGTVTKSPLAIVYAAGAPAYNIHLSSGLIGQGSANSLAVHPVPLYEILFSIIILVIFLRFRSFPKIPGNRMFALVSLYSFLRFGGEFLRYQPLESALSTAQIATLISGCFFLLIVLYRETGSKAYIRRPAASASSSGKLQVTGITLTGTILTANWFVPVEYFLITTTLGLLLIYYVYRSGLVKILHYRTLKYAWVPLVSVSFIVAFTTSSKSDSTDKSFFRYSFGFFNGKYGAWDIERGRVVEECGCGSCYDTYPDWDGIERSYRYTGGGASLEYVTEKSEYSSSIFGLRVQSGQTVTPAASTERRNLSAENEFTFLINPFYRYEGKFIGFGAGMHLGTSPFRNLGNESGSRGHMEQDKVKFLPMLYLRLLRHDRLFIEGRIYDAELGGVPLMHYQLGTGVGFTMNDRLGSFRLGISDWGFYIEPDFPLFNSTDVFGRFVIDRQSGSQIDNQFHVSVGLRYTPSLK